MEITNRRQRRAKRKREKERRQILLVATVGAFIIAAGVIFRFAI